MSAMWPERSRSVPRRSTAPGFSWPTGPWRSSFMSAAPRSTEAFRLCCRWYRSHRRQHRLAGEVGAQVVDHEVAHGAAGFASGAGGMRLQHHLLHLQQRLRHIGLGLEDVEAGAAEASFLQGGDKSRLVDHRAARHVDEHRSEEHTSELQSLMRIPYAVFCLKKKKRQKHIRSNKDILKEKKLKKTITSNILNTINKL